MYIERHGGIIFRVFEKSARCRRSITVGFLYVHLSPSVGGKKKPTEIERENSTVLVLVITSTVSSTVSHTARHRLCHDMLLTVPEARSQGIELQAKTEQRSAADSS